MTRLARENNTVVLIDGAQAVPHMQVDVQALGCDFYAFSGHKMCGPTGAGVLYARPALLEEMPPFLVGGGMVRSAGVSGALYSALLALLTWWLDHELPCPPEQMDEIFRQLTIPGVAATFGKAP